MSGYDGMPVVPFNLTQFVPMKCEYLGSALSSTGLFQNDDVFKHPLPILLLQIGTSLLMTTVLHYILKPFNQPRFVAEMLTGILLGPSIFRHIETGGLYQKLFELKPKKVMRLLEYICFGMYGYIVGVRTDISIIKASGTLSWILGFVGIALPTGIAYSINILLGKFHFIEAEILMPICPFVAQSSFHVTSILLDELNLLNSEIGRLALSSSLITSIFSWIYTISTNFYYYSYLFNLSLLDFIERQAYRLVLVAFIVFGLRSVMFWMIRKVPDGKSIKEWHFFTMVVMLFGVGFLSESMGYSLFFGMMILGLAVPPGPPLGSGMVQRLSLFVSAVLLPLYIVNAGRVVDVSVIDPDNYTVAMVVIGIAAYLAKLIGAVVPLRFCNVPYKDAFALALIVSFQGLFDVFFFKIALRHGLVNKKFYSIITIMAVLIAMITTPIIKYLYDPSKRYINYKRRTLQHSNREHELRMLVCLHEEDNVFSIMNILKASNPHKKSPIEAFVVDLMELIGREIPLLINHQLHKGRSSTLNRANRIITTFHQFEQHQEGIKHQHFTVIAPYGSMHDDICMLALEKSVSLLIIPFQNSESIAIRGVKKNVLDKAPCSVGILVDKKIVMYWRPDCHDEIKFNVCVIFLGGPDSREALALGMRMVENSAIRLTVIRLIAKDDFITDLVETKLDVRAINELKNLYKSNEGIEYTEVIVKDGANTIEVLQFLDDQYDLMLVGRRHDNESPLVSGLANWSFVSELGIIGDILASSDMQCNASVLVLQQQSTVEDLLLMIYNRNFNCFIVISFLFVQTGILLGPSIFRHIETGGLYQKLFELKPKKVMRLLEYICFGMYGYIVGVRTDISIIKASGTLSWILGFVGIALPTGIAYSINILLGKFHFIEAEILMPICPFVAQSSFHVTSILLDELNLLNSEIGRLALSSSLITSIFSWIYTISTNFYYYSYLFNLSLLDFIERQAYRLVLVAFIVFGLRSVMFWMIRKVPDGKSIKEWHFFTMVVMLFGVGFLSESMGYSLFFGMMILGLAVPPGPPLGSGMVQRLSLFVSAVLLPLYIVNAGRVVDVSVIDPDNYTVAMVVIGIAAYLAKLIGAVVPLRFCNVPYKDAFALALIVSFQGLFDVFFFKIALRHGLVNKKFYSIITIMAVLIAMITTPIIKYLYDPSKRYINYKRRTLQHSNREHELRMLVCLHEEDNVFSIMNILKASNPHKKSPIEAFVVDLMELIGREIPLLISHQLHKGRSSTLNRANRIITTFHQFEQHQEGIKHQHFTVIAPYGSMHDDICMLALEKSVSLLIIPFQNSESIAIRGVKKNVLDKAPCSVGILVDKKIVMYWRPDCHDEIKFNVCVIFLGGPDSREALALGMRMVENSAIRLTVIRLIAKDDFITDLVETKLDVRAINELKNLYKSNEGIEYTEVIVKDGANTIEVLQFLDDQYDLMLVGRRHDNESPLVSGLANWSFVSELGIIGDILASSDMQCNASVLVLQQQSTVEDLLRIPKE
ncbi:hypothetical protein ACSBR1_035763 [Camellia fascicularis]